MIDRIPTEVLGDAAFRANQIMARFGVYAFWRLNMNGLTLCMANEGEYAEKSLTWDQLTITRFPQNIMRDLEHDMLRAVVPRTAPDGE